MSKPIHFEYQDFPQCRVVTLDSKLSDYGFQHTLNADGRLMQTKPEATIKDCRHIDGCVYFHLGRVSDTVMCDLIEKFQKLLKEDGWRQHDGLIVPDPKFKF